MAIAAIVVGFLVSLIGGPSLLNHLSQKQVEHLQQSEDVQQSQLAPQQQGQLAPMEGIGKLPSSASVAKERSGT
jgi:hypothetical protein